MESRISGLSIACTMPEQIKTRKAGLASLCAHTRPLHGRTCEHSPSPNCGSAAKRKKEKGKSKKKKRGSAVGTLSLCHPIFRRFGGDSERAFSRDSRETRGALTWPDKIVRVPLIIHTRRRRDIARATLEIARVHIRGFSPLSSQKK